MVYRGLTLHFLDKFSVASQLAAAKMKEKAICYQLELGNTDPLGEGHSAGPWQKTEAVGEEGPAHP